MFRAHLRSALEVIEREAPVWSERLAASVGDIRIGVEVDGAPFRVVRRERAIHLDDGDTVDVVGRCGRAAVDDLIEGRTTLEEAVESGRVDLRGDLDALLVLDEALRTFVNAAVRCPGMVDNLAAWRTPMEGYNAKG